MTTPAGAVPSGWLVWYKRKSNSFSPCVVQKKKKNENPVGWGSSYSWNESLRLMHYQLFYHLRIIKKLSLWFFRAFALHERDQKKAVGIWIICCVWH